MGRRRSDKFIIGFFPSVGSVEGVGVPGVSSVYGGVGSVLDVGLVPSVFDVGIIQSVGIIRGKGIWYPDVVDDEDSEDSEEVFL